MAKCLVTKLNGSSNNPSLKKIGETQIYLKKIDNQDKTTQGFWIKLSKDSDIEVIGDGYFTDSSLSRNEGKTLHVTANKGKSFFINCNSDCVLSILDKYNLIGYSIYDINNALKDNKHKSFDIDDLKYSTGLVELRVQNSSVYGDIASLKNCAELGSVYLTNSDVYGDIASFADKTKLSIIDASVKNISGNIASISGLTAITSINVSNTNVSGGISAFANFTKATSINVSNTNVSGDISSLANVSALAVLLASNTNVSGDISALKNLQNLTSAYLKSTNVISGDLAVMPARFELLSVNSNATLTWSDRPASSYIIGVDGNPKFEDVDSFLIGEAKCAKPTSPRLSTIRVTGNKTSASDAAVQTLQSKGYTVSVTPA